MVISVLIGVTVHGVSVRFSAVIAGGWQGQVRIPVVEVTDGGWHLSRFDRSRTLGITENDANLVELAVDDFSRVITLADPQVDCAIYNHALLALGAVLANSGRTYSNLKTANEHLQEARGYFRGRRLKASREHAHLDWQTAMVRFELRRYPEGRQVVKQRPNKLRAILKRSLETFLEVNMPAESSAVAADLTTPPAPGPGDSFLSCSFDRVADNSTRREESDENQS